MNTIEVVQVGGAAVALSLQVTSTYLAYGIRGLVPYNLWLVLVGLNVFECAQWLLSIAALSHLLPAEAYSAVTIAVGLLIAAVTLALVVKIKRHAKLVQKNIQDLANASVMLAKEHSAEQSIAYQLAVHFIRQKDSQ